MKALIKGLLLLLAILFCIVLLGALRLIFLFYPKMAKSSVSSMVHLSGKIFTFILGIKIRVSGDIDLFKKKGAFFVCNHLSYIDGIVAASLAPLVFVAKADIRNWPLLGALIYLSHTVFINRNKPLDIDKDIGRIRSFLKNKINVVIFPEGTSGNGSFLLPFKSSLFAAPFESGGPIIPLALIYRQINGQALTEKNKDLVYWYGDMLFFPHLVHLLRLNEVVIEIKVCEPLWCAVSASADFSQRKIISATCWERINNGLRAAGAVGNN